MVARASNAVQIQSGSNVEARLSGVGLARPDFNKRRESTVTQAPNLEDSSGDRLLQNILGVAGKIAEQQFEMGKEEAYLQGSANAGILQSEAELEGNPLTKGWAVAGYRDTMGRMSLAEREAKIATDMAKLKEKSPSDFKDYLAEQRKEALPQWEGMSAKARQGIFAQTMVNEAAAIKTHGAKHAEFIVDQKLKAVHTVYKVSEAKLNTSKDNPEVYKANTLAVMTDIYTNVIRDESMSDDMRRVAIEQIATSALAGNHQGLYAAMGNDEITKLDGSKGTMLGYLDFDTAVKVSKQYATSMQATAALRHQKDNDEQASILAHLGKPETPEIPYATMQANITRWIQNGSMDAKGDGAQSQAMMQRWHEKSLEKSQSGDKVAAYKNGDTEAMHRLGVTPEETRQAWMKAEGSKMPVEQAVGQMYMRGIMNGDAGNFKAIGELVKPAFAQSFTNPDAIDPANAKIMQVTMALVSSPDTPPEALHMVLSSFPELERGRLLRVSRLVKDGKEASDAIRTVNAEQLANAKMDKSLLAATDRKRGEAGAKYRDELTPQGIWGSGWNAVKSVVSSDAASKGRISVKSHWSENESLLNERMAASKMAYGESWSDSLITQPYLTNEDRHTLSLSSVVDRTVPTSTGPIILPNGTDFRQFFGIKDPNVTADRIGAAMDEFLKPADGNSISFRVANGRIMFDEKDEDNNLVRPGSLDPKQIAGLVQAQKEREVQRFKLSHGVGTTRSVKYSGGEAKVSFNGDNTVGIDNGWMFELRNRLVDHESIRDTPYKDLSGKVVNGKQVETVGVGVSSHNPHYPKLGPDGKVSQEEIDRSFKLASNQAAGGAYGVMRRNQLGGKPVFQLFGELAYQSGPSFDQLNSYKPMIEAIKRKDTAAAQQAFLNTPAYRWAGDSDRRKSYIKMINEATKG